jgi:hypothetical protein
LPIPTILSAVAGTLFSLGAATVGSLPVPAGARESAGVRPPVAAVTWEPLVEMGSEIFPSYALATATAKTWNGVPRVLVGETEIEGQATRYVGDVLGMLGAVVRTPRAGARVRVEVDAPDIADRSGVEAVLSTAGRRVELFPVMRYKWPVLTALRQSMPASVTFRVYVDGALAAEETRVIRVRSINDAPTAVERRSGGVEDLSWMFAAYVNEDHPAVDQVLRQALAARVVTQFSGYQEGDADAVWQQVYAVWNAFQRRGVRYSSITRTAASSDSVASQHVRTFGEALASSQANCVDGSVLFASMLRKIDVDPFLVLRPGHMYVGFYLDEKHTSIGLLETTMLGSEDLKQYADGGLLGALSASLVSRRERCLVALVPERGDRRQDGARSGRTAHPGSGAGLRAHRHRDLPQGGRDAHREVVRPPDPSPPRPPAASRRPSPACVPSTSTITRSAAIRS